MRNAVVRRKKLKAYQARISLLGRLAELNRPVHVRIAAIDGAMPFAYLDPKDQP